MNGHKKQKQKKTRTASELLVWYAFVWDDDAALLSVQVYRDREMNAINDNEIDCKFKLITITLNIDRKRKIKCFVNNVDAEWQQQQTYELKCNGRIVDNDLHSNSL